MTLNNESITIEWEIGMCSFDEIRDKIEIKYGDKELKVISE